MGVPQSGEPLLTGSKLQVMFATCFGSRLRSTQVSFEPVQTAGGTTPWFLLDPGAFAELPEPFGWPESVVRAPRS